MEDDGGGQQLRQENSEELPEDVAQRQQVEKTQGMEDALVSQVRADPALQRLQVGEDVPVRNDHTARLSGGARGEDDLHDVVAGERRRSAWHVGANGNPLAEGFQMHGWNFGDLVLRHANAKLGVHLLRDTLGELGSGNVVDWNNDDAAQQTSKESNYPLGTVFTPDEDLVAPGNLSRVELAREAMRVGQHLTVGPALRAIAAMLHVGNLAGVPPEVVEVLEDGGVRHQEQFNCSGRIRMNGRAAGYSLGSTMPFWPWYLPFLSL